MIKIEAVGYIKHDGRHYEPGAAFDVTDEEAERLFGLGVAKAVPKPKPAPKPPKPPAPPKLTAAAVAELNAADAVKAIEACTDSVVLAAIVEHDERKTVVEAAEKRRAELLAE